jgi:SAM-dependent methyltransferase
MSVIFNWKEEDFGNLLKSCDKDEVTPYILKYLPKSGKIIEAGCGLGRFVKYLSDRGYDNIIGIEYNRETVHCIKKIAPELNIIQGDVLSMPYQAHSIDGIISLGVIEHFPSEGCDRPIKEMYRILKSGGMAIITVPSFNLIRRIKKYLYVNEINYFLNPINIARRLNIIRRFLKKKIENGKFSYNRNKSKYFIYPMFGDFFEFRFTKNQFEDLLISVGFTIVESMPICHMDGIYHEFGKLFVSFKNWEFFPNSIGRFLNRVLSRISFCHNHMHVCVVRKN